MSTTAKDRASQLHNSEQLLEEGAAFMKLEGARHREDDDGGEDHRPETEVFDVVVIGAGQAGLSVGYYLAQRGLRFVIVDAGERIGDAWRNRWDSLRLFTPAKLGGLDGMPFPAPPESFPTKDEMADYLESYAEHFELPVRTRMRVSRLWRAEGSYFVAAGDCVLEADHVVVAMANYQHKLVPDFAAELAPTITQLHSLDYRNPGQLRDGEVLIVGAGNSGAEIAKELSRSHDVYLSGRHTGNVPFRIDGLLGRLVLYRLLLRFVFHRVLTVRTPMGRKARPALSTGGGPLIRVKPKELRRLGVEWVSKTEGVDDGKPRLADGRVLDVANVVWCTGFHPGFSWIDLPIHGEDGAPRHHGGVAVGEPGLYFVGLHFLYAMSSAMVHGVGRDARRIVDTIVERS